MGRILGIDYGKKRIGIAVTDELEIIASPLKVILNDSFVFEKIKSICEEYKVKKIVLGFPFSEKYNEAMLEVTEFSKKLREKINNIEVHFQNEEFSTVQSEYFLKSLGQNPKKIKESIDKYAAQKILADYLKENKKES